MADFFISFFHVGIESPNRVRTKLPKCHSFRTIQPFDRFSWIERQSVGIVVGVIEPKGWRIIAYGAPGQKTRNL